MHHARRAHLIIAVSSSGSAPRSGQLLIISVSSVRQEYEAIGKAPLFDEQKESLWSGAKARSHKEIARLFDTTEDAIKSVAYRLRRRVGQRFREEGARTLESPGAIESEIRHLLAAGSQQPDGRIRAAQIVSRFQVAAPAVGSR